MSQPNITVTDRYITNLLNRGHNASFELDFVTQKISSEDGIPVGKFYRVEIKKVVSFESAFGIGSSPVAAARRALEKHGISFR